MRRDPKFIQIAVSFDTEISTEFVYALDEDGRVWYFVHPENKWFPLSSERGEEEEEEEEELCLHLSFGEDGHCLKCGEPRSRIVKADK